MVDRFREVDLIVKTSRELGIRPLAHVGAQGAAGWELEQVLVTPIRPAIGLPAAWFVLSILVVSNLFFPIGELLQRLFFRRRGGGMIRC